MTMLVLMVTTDEDNNDPGGDNVDSDVDDDKDWCLMMLVLKMMKMTIVEDFNDNSGVNDDDRGMCWSWW